MIKQKPRENAKSAGELRSEKASAINSVTVTAVIAPAAKASAHAIYPPLEKSIAPITAHGISTAPESTESKKLFPFEQPLFRNG